MRWLILSLFVTFTFLLAAYSQVAPSEQVPERATYFLIDASGSMAESVEGSAPTITLGQQAEIKITEIKEKIQAENPNAKVSRTYFRAINRDLCDQSIRVAPLAAIATDAAEPRTYGNDFTPLGTALESAIQIVGDQNADIYLISDGRESTECGPAVCEVARKHLPLPNVDIIPVVLGANESEPSSIECINEAESRSVLDNASDSSESAAGTTVDSSLNPIGSKIYTRWVLRFFERWWWLIGIVCLACSAIGIGRRESERAQLFEDGAEDAKSLQKLIRENDSEAAAELGVLLANVKSKSLDMRGTRRPIKLSEVDADKMKGVRLDKLDVGVRWSRIIVDYPVGFVGGLILACLAFLPDQVFEVGLKGAKTAAWDVLDSDFATAFAITWIAIIIFAGNQHQRRREAIHQFGLATREAERIAEIERSDAVRVAFERHSKLVRKVEGITEEIVRYADTSSDEQLPVTTKADAMLIAGTLRDIAVGPKVNATDKVETISDAARRLSDLVERGFMQPRVDAAQLVQQFEARSELPGNADRWRNLRLAILQRKQDRICAAIAELADELRRSKASTK